MNLKILLGLFMLLGGGIGIYLKTQHLEPYRERYEKPYEKYGNLAGMVIGVILIYKGVSEKKRPP